MTVYDNPTMLIAAAISIASLVIYLIVHLVKVLDCDLTLYFCSFFGKSTVSLKGKVIWISGASSGIGEALAYELAKSGVKLALSGHLDSLYDVGNKCLAMSKGKLKASDVLVIHPFDIRETQHLETVVNQVTNHFGRIDVLVNNIGRTQRAAFEDITSEDEKAIFEINVFGQINLSRLVMRHFLENKSGHFVVTSSVAGKFGAPNSATYTGSKHALLGFFETIRTEGFTKGIVVTTVCPGPVQTPLVERAFHSSAFTNEIRESSTIKEGRLCVQRCAYLMGVGISNQLIEVWIALKPILWFVYISQYTPNIAKMVLIRLITPEAQMRIREGNKKK